MTNKARKSLDAQIVPLASTVALADALAEAHEACGQPVAAGEVRWSVMMERQRLRLLRMRRDAMVEMELDAFLTTMD